MIAAARQRVLIVVAAADADQLVDFVVVRRNILVANGPRDFPAIAFGAGEVQVGVAERDAAPDVRLAATAPNPDEVEGLPGRSLKRSGLQIDVELRRLLAGGELLLRLPWLH